MLVNLARLIAKAIVSVAVSYAVLTLMGSAATADLSTNDTDYQIAIFDYHTLKENEDNKAA